MKEVALEGVTGIKERGKEMRLERGKEEGLEWEGRSEGSERDEWEE